MTPNVPEPRPWLPLRIDVEDSNRIRGRQVFHNAYYTVTRADQQWGGRTLLIVNADQSARRDWREFQQIKDELLGRKAVAVELYPAHDDVLDPTNAFLLHEVLIPLPFLKKGRYMEPGGIIQRALAEGLTI